MNKLSINILLLTLLSISVLDISARSSRLENFMKKLVPAVLKRTPAATKPTNPLSIASLQPETPATTELAHLQPETPMRRGMLHPNISNRSIEAAIYETENRPNMIYRYQDRTTTETTSVHIEENKANGTVTFTGVFKSSNKKIAARMVLKNNPNNRLFPLLETPNEINSNTEIFPNQTSDNQPHIIDITADEINSTPLTDQTSSDNQSDTTSALTKSQEIPINWYREINNSEKKTITPENDKQFFDATHNIHDKNGMELIRIMANYGYTRWLRDKKK